jgi:hypothetical protein
MQTCLTKEEAEAQKEGEIVRDEGVILRASMVCFIYINSAGIQRLVASSEEYIRSARSRPAILWGRVIGPHLSFRWHAQLPQRLILIT